MTPPATGGATAAASRAYAGAPLSLRRERALPGTRRRPRPAAPRRVSGAAPDGHAPASARHAQAQGGLALWLRALYARVATGRLLGRLIAGKAWIALVAFALIGIVTMQLGLLELNTTIGRLLEREGSLQRENAALSIENSEIAAGDRVETLAGKLGMELVPAGALRFLTPRPGDLARAASVLNASAPGASSAAVPSEGQALASGEQSLPSEAHPEGRTQASASGAAGAGASGAPASSGGESAGASGQAASNGVASQAPSPAPSSEASTPASSATPTQPSSVTGAASSPSSSPSQGQAGSGGSAGGETGVGGGTGTQPAAGQ
ncbi:MAG TPA: hypothetical protein VKG82_10775 [Solirubrobacteraceae bacterium]|nr:hypothetical protein [Solirubrobacteraceae bacterium]